MSTSTTDGGGRREEFDDLFPTGSPEQAEFSIGFRGYDREEVDAAVADLGSKLQSVSARLASLEDRHRQELEEQRFGSTLKNLGHYLMASGSHFRREELRFDLMDLPAAGLSDNFRRFGPFARLVMLVTRHRLDKMRR